MTRYGEIVQLGPMQDRALRQLEAPDVEVSDAIVKGLEFIAAPDTTARAHESEDGAPQKTSEQDLERMRAAAAALAVRSTYVRA